MTKRRDKVPFMTLIPVSESPQMADATWPHLAELFERSWSGVRESIGPIHYIASAQPRAGVCRFVW